MSGKKRNLHVGIWRVSDKCHGKMLIFLGELKIQSIDRGKNSVPYTDTPKIWRVSDTCHGKMLIFCKKNTIYGTEFLQLEPGKVANFFGRENYIFHNRSIIN